MWTIICFIKANESVKYCLFYFCFLSKIKIKEWLLVYTMQQEASAERSAFKTNNLWLLSFPSLKILGIVTFKVDLWIIDNFFFKGLEPQFPFHVLNLYLPELNLIFCWHEVG